MCGRFSRITGSDEIKSRYELSSVFELLPSYNIAPKNDVSVIAQNSNQTLSVMKWGLVPWWSKTKDFTYNYINVRADKILQNKTTKTLIKTGRCIIPASGFYEWKKQGNRKIPHYFTVNENEIFSLAGLYSVWELDNAPLYTFAIITIDANTLVKDIHHRMPVILQKFSEHIWLDNEASQSDILGLMRPYQSELMSVHEVSTQVNSVKNNSSDLIRAVTNPSYNIIKKQKVKQSSLDEWF